MASIREDLSNLGVATTLAAEFQAQITASSYNARRLFDLGFVPAAEFVKQAVAGDINVNALCELGVPTVIAKYIANAIDTAPVNTVAPVASGTPQEGETLTTTNGTWTGPGAISYAYQWKRDGGDISGATSSTYDLVADDVDAMVKCTVTATNAHGSTSADSNELGPVVTA